jgi:subtilisin family serine protease
MKKLIAMIMTLFLFTSALTAQKILDYLPNQLIVKFNETTYSTIRDSDSRIPKNISVNSKLLAAFQTINANRIERLLPIEKDTDFGKRTGLDRNYVLYFEGNIGAEEVGSLLKEKGLIEEYSLNYIMTFDSIPNDPKYSEQWALPKVNMSSSWDYQKGNPDIKIAILDNGFKLTHEDLQNKFSSEMRDETDIDTQFYINSGYTLVTGEDYTTPDNDPTGLGTHGTHVAGIAAASTNNSLGVAGIGWNSTIVPVRCGFIVNVKLQMEMDF